MKNYLYALLLSIALCGAAALGAVIFLQFDSIKLLINIPTRCLFIPFIIGLCLQPTREKLNIMQNHACVRFCLYVGLGITLEVIWTTINTVFITQTQTLEWTMVGTTYVWSMPIYGFGFLLFEKILSIRNKPRTERFDNSSPYLSQYTPIIRLLIYGVLFMAAWFIIGYVIFKMTGQIPWQFDNHDYMTITFIGIVNLWYFPLWCLVGLMLETILINIIDYNDLFMEYSTIWEESPLDWL